MKNKKLSFTFVVVLLLCVSTLILAACNKNNDTSSTGSDFSEGDVIVDRDDNTVTEKYYDDAGREVREISHVETLYNVTYLANDASVIYLKGNKNDEMYVSGYDGVPTSLVVKDLESKISLDGNAIVIKGITEEAFKGCETLVSVDLEKENTNSLTFAIGNQAFANCPNLATVTLPTKVYMKSGSIGDNAFYNCESLTNIVIPDRFKTLGAYAFANCLKLETVTFSEGVAKVPEGFLYGCEALTSVTIPSTVNYVGSRAFSDCKKLTAIAFPNSVTYVGNKALENCISLQSVKIPFIGNSYNPTSSSTFGDLFGMSDIVDPDTQESYLYESFNNHFIPKTLTSVEVTNATSLPAYAFAGIESLTTLSITYTTADRIRVYGADTDYDNYDVPAITTVGAYAFKGLDQISEFQIPEKATTIGDGAFASTGLTNTSLAAILMNAKNVGSYAFSSLEKVTEISIPQNVLSVSRYAFARNASLTSFLSTANTALSNGTIAECRSLETVTVPYIGTSSIYYEDIDSDPVIVSNNTPFASLFSTSEPFDLYEEDDAWRVEENYYSAYGYYVPNTLGTITVSSATEIPTNAFREILASNITIALSSDMLSDIDFDGVTIESYAFYGCENLTSFTLDNNYKDISSYAFKNSGLESVTIPSSVRRIADNAFANCENLTSFAVSGKNTAIYSGILANCRSLESVTVPYIGTAFWTTDTYYDEYLSYANNAFANLFSSNYPDDMYSTTDTFRESPRYYGVATGNYSSYYVPVSLNTIDVTNAQAIPYSAFRGILAHNITVNYDEDADLTTSARTSIDAYAFYGCENLTSFTIDSHIANINNYAFASSGLERITIPTSVTYVSSNAFENCSNLRSLTWDAAYASIPDFSKSNITTLTLGENVYDIPSNAFSNMSYLTTVNVNASELNSIGSNAFGATPWLTTQTGAVYLGKILFKYIGTIPENSTPNTPSFAVRAGTVAIENYALQNQSDIEDIYIPASVTRFGDYAFSGCDNLSVVLYGGTQEQYDSISKTSSSLNADGIIYNYVNSGTRTYEFSSDGLKLTEYMQTTNYLRTLPTPSERTDYIFCGWYENEGFSGKPVSAPYYNRTNIILYARWLTQEEYDALRDGTSFEKAFVAELGQTYDVNITTTPNSGVYFKFVPTTSGSYSITASNTSGDNYGHLYDSSQTEIANNNDGAGNSNFKITYSLVAGETYYIRARMYDSNSTGSFQITINLN